MSHGGQQGEVRAISGLRGGANGLAGGLPPCGPCEITFEFPARTDKVTLRQSVDRPKAQRRKPQGKGGWAGDAACKSGRACLGGRGNAPAGGRQARTPGQCPDLSTDKSGKKEGCAVW